MEFLLRTIIYILISIVVSFCFEYYRQCKMAKILRKQNPWESFWGDNKIEDNDILNDDEEFDDNDDIRAD